jgi:hypothetical protein
MTQWTIDCIAEYDADDEPIWRGMGTYPNVAAAILAVGEDLYYQVSEWPGEAVVDAFTEGEFASANRYIITRSFVGGFIQYTVDEKEV